VLHFTVRDSVGGDRRGEAGETVRAQKRLIVEGLHKWFGLIALRSSFSGFV
jgi:hypothetical protein